MKVIIILHTTSYFYKGIIYVTRFGKTDQIVTFCISRNTKLKNFSHCGSFLLERKLHQIHSISRVVL